MRLLPVEEAKDSVMRLNIRNKYQCAWLATQNIALAWDSQKKEKHAIESGMTISKLWLYVATDNHLLNLRTWELLVTIMPIICVMINRPLQSKFTYLSPFHSCNSPVWLGKHYLHFYNWEKWGPDELSDLPKNTQVSCKIGTKSVTTNSQPCIPPHRQQCPH